MSLWDNEFGSRVLCPQILNAWQVNYQSVAALTRLVELEIDEMCGL